MTRNPGDTQFRENGVRVNQINQGLVLTETEKARKSAQGLPDDWYKDISNFCSCRTNSLAFRNCCCCVLVSR